MAEFDTSEIPLSKVCDKYFGLSLQKASQQARTQNLPIPVYRGGSQKSQWLVSAKDLAEWLDTKKEQARHDWERLNNASAI
jgi:hypothetical protein